MSTGGYGHQPVLLDEVLNGMNINDSGLYVDCTYGRGGHTRAILARLGLDGRVLAMDRDPDAVEVGAQHASDDRRLDIERGPFTMLAKLARKFAINGKVNGLLFDLGVSSPQLDDPGRGFSFMRPGPLDMRMDPDSGLSAADWLASVEEEELIRVLREYGEERFARRIARAIIAAGQQAPLQTTDQLVDVIVAAKPNTEKKIHPATRAFQAIRIAVNNELGELKSALTQVIDCLAPGGRLLVISFHSLEDRIVKRFIRRESRGDPYPADLPVPADLLCPRLRPIGRAIRATAAECAANPRARSATLRIAERLA